ncbi:MAG: four helix bundle protein [Symploca sp. SIO2C1]|nr:four helix bundle protein [Symploca sp. SIO2C1]
MVEVKSYRDLKVWNRAMDLVIMCYRLTSKLPKTEVYGLTSQIQRAAVSIPANVAEGKGRHHLGEYIHHLSIANGSLKELETHLLIAERLSYLENSELHPVFELADEVGKMLNTLIKALKERQKNLKSNT